MVRLWQGWQCPTPRFRVQTRRAIGPQSRRSLPPPLPPPFGNQSGRGIGRDRSSTSRGDTIRRGGSGPPTSRLPVGGVRRPAPRRAHSRPRRWPARAWIASASRPTTRSDPSADHNHRVDARGERRNRKIRAVRLPPPPPPSSSWAYPPTGAASATQDSSGHTPSRSTTSSPRTAATETGTEDVAAETRTTAVRSVNCRVGYRFGFAGQHPHKGRIRHPRRSGRGFHLGIGTG